MPNRQPRSRARLLTVALACALLAAVCAPSAFARVTPRASAAHKAKVQRVGGRVHRAWPFIGRPPQTALGRWLARQVGPTKLRPCRRHVGRHTIACWRIMVAGDRSLHVPQAGQTASDAASMTVGGPLRMAAGAASGSGTLLLARSYAIPTNDPAYSSLANWSWTYDSAVTATAFAVTGASSDAEQLLDQLAALQNTDGSIDLAFNVATGQAQATFRAGTIAWVGLAGTIFDQDFASSRYLHMEKLAASYLLSLQGTNGLIRGGPDVSWYSTQNNLLAYAFLAHLGAELLADGSAAQAATYDSAAGRIAAAIDANLIVESGSSAYFMEGLGDPVQALDVQALGAMYLNSRGQTTRAAQVLGYAESAFAVTGRSINLSSDPSTYNMTYSAPGPFSGLAPYIGTDAPNVLWPEGTAEVRLAAASLGQPTTALDEDLAALAAVTPNQGGALLQSDQTLTSARYGVSYHVWPAAAAGAWQLLAQAKRVPALFPRVTATDLAAR